MNFRHLVLAFALLFFTSGCLATKAQQGGASGVAAGAIIGQALGKSTEATLLGAAIGGVIGYAIGTEMDKEDRQRLNNVYEHTPDNAPTEWSNPNNGNAFMATPQRTYQDRTTNRDCREVEILATISGSTEKTNTTACRENGQWLVQQ